MATQVAREVDDKDGGTDGIQDGGEHGMPETLAVYLSGSYGRDMNMHCRGDADELYHTLGILVFCLSLSLQ